MNQTGSRLDQAQSPHVRPDVSEHDDKISVETLTLGHHPATPTHPGHRWPLAIVTVLGTIAALVIVGARVHHEPDIVGALSAPVDILVLGDASAGSKGCGNCFSYVDQLAAAASDDGRRRTRIDDKTMSDQSAPPSMPALVESLSSTPELRSSVEKADVILLAMGSGDVTPCSQSQRTPCPAETIPQFRRSVTDWMAETAKIRQDHPVKIRVITPPPTSGSPRQNDVARITCEIAAAHHAGCVNVYALARTDEHIVDHRTDPSHAHLTQHGHDRVARSLIALGTLRPIQCLRRTS